MGVVSVALGSVASAQMLTPAENRCQVSVSKAGAKFWASKAKCVIKCVSNARRGGNPITDCFPPYSGATGQCIADTVLHLKGAEDKFHDAIRKACDPSFKIGTDCPECYSGGDCSVEANYRVRDSSTAIDVLLPSLFCDQIGTPPNANDAETACEFNTVKVLSKLVASVDRCYDKCYAGARKVPPLNPLSDCTPPGAGATGACLEAADAKSVLGFNAKCGTVGVLPDCNGVPDSYPHGLVFTIVKDIASAGISQTYCTTSTSTTSTTNPCFRDPGDGTIVDTCTGLQWEKKDGTPGGGNDPADLHDVDNQYPWSGCCGGYCVLANLCQPNAAAAATCAALADGGVEGCGTCEGTGGACIVDPSGITTVWDWLNQLNAANFAGYSDWRLPSEGGWNTGSPAPRELETIRSAPCPIIGPCVASIFGPTSVWYWASTTVHPAGGFGYADGAYVVDFRSDSVGGGGKSGGRSVRAVRGP